MSRDEYSAELRRLAKHSLRLRAYLAVKPRYSQTWALAERAAVLRRLVRELKLQLGEPVIPDVPWHDSRGLAVEPVSFDDAQRYLQRPELFDTENYQAMLWHADVGKPGSTHVNADLKRFIKLVIRLARDRRVPLFAERVWTSPGDQGMAYATGLSSIPPREFPFCYGRTVLFGHAAEPDWRPACLAWLNTLADLAAAELAIGIGYGPETPGQFTVADAHGVLCEFDGEFPDPNSRDETARAFAFYSGGDWVPAPSGEAFTVETMAGYRTSDGREVLPVGWVKPASYVEDVNTVNLGAFNRDDGSKPP